MKLDPEDQKRLLRAIRLTYQIQANFLREQGQVLEARPKRSGPASRKRRTCHEN